MSTKSLKNIQKAFLNAVYHNSTMDGIIENGINSDERMAIYRNNVKTSLIDTIIATYPLCAKLTDERFLRYAANEYIKAHPSKSGNLDDYGDQFASFLKTFEPCKDLPYLPELATFEWTKQQSYLATDAEQKKLAKPTPGTTLNPKPATFLLKFNHRIDRLVQFIKEASSAPSTPDLQGSSYTVITRPELEVNVFWLDQRWYEMLENIVAGTPVKTGWLEDKEFTLLLSSSFEQA